MQCCCSTEAETGFVPTSAQFFAVGTFLILRSPSWTFLYAEVQRVNVFRPQSCSQSIRQRIRRRTVTLYFNLHWNSQILVHRSQDKSNSTSFHHCVKLRFSNALDPDFSVIANLSHQYHRAFSRDWIRQRKRSPRRLILSTRSCLRYLNAGLCFPTRYRATRFIGIKSNSRGSRFCWARCFAVSARSDLSWVKCKKSRAHRSVSCCILSLPNRTLSTVSNFSCSFSCGVITVLVFRSALRFIDDEWCMSQVRLNVHVLSSLIGPNSQHTVQQQKAFHV